MDPGLHGDFRQDPPNPGGPQVAPLAQAPPPGFREAPVTPWSWATRWVDPDEGTGRRQCLPQGLLGIKALPPPPQCPGPWGQARPFMVDGTSGVLSHRLSTWTSAFVPSLAQLRPHLLQEAFEACLLAAPAHDVTDWGMWLAQEGPSDRSSFHWGLRHTGRRVWISYLDPGAKVSGQPLLLFQEHNK